MARASDGAGPPNARIIETATSPTAPTFPKPAPTVILATLAGFFVALGVAAARALIAEDGGKEFPPERTPAVGEVRQKRDVRSEPTPVSAPQETHASAEPPAWERAPQETHASAESPSGESALATAVESLAAAAPTGPLAILVAGEGARGALAIALAAARRLADRAGVVLVDVGVTQAWLADVVDHGPDGQEGFAGLDEVIAGRADFEAALHRDLSSRVDILPAGSEPVEPEDLEPVLAALAECYDFVVIHASDWRTPLGREALKAAGAAILCASAPKLGPMCERLEWAAEGRALQIAQLALEPSEAVTQAA